VKSAFPRVDFSTAATTTTLLRRTRLLPKEVFPRAKLMAFFFLLHSTRDALSRSLALVIASAWNIGIVIFFPARILSPPPAIG